jgi:hypothetical protein
VKTTRLAVAGLILATLATACGSSDEANSQPTFCEVAQAVKAAADVQQKLFDAVDPPAAADVQPAIDDFALKFAAMNSISPADIKADVETLNDAAQQLATIVRKNNFNVVAMVSTPEFAALNDTFGSDAYTSAQNKFQLYLDTKCVLAATPGT